VLVTRRPSFRIVTSIYAIARIGGVHGMTHFPPRGFAKTRDSDHRHTHARRVSITVSVDYGRPIVTSSAVIKLPMSSSGLLQE
jgi:hypothetical protein